MEKTNTEIEGVYIINSFRADDNRGSFIKIFNQDEFDNLNLPKMNIKETYYSVSNKNVIRGMHFQIPPFDHEKIVTVLEGKAIDVIVDLRKNSSTYGKVISIELSEENNLAVFIPKGCAHGFKTLKDNTRMLYMVSTAYSKEHDSGIRWNSIDYNWDVEDEIVSERDNNLTQFKDFDSPF